MQRFEFIRYEDGNGWINDYEKGLKYPDFDGKTNETSTQEELQEFCEEIDREILRKEILK